jgi:ATP-binding cassette subfamily F protein uup
VRALKDLRRERAQRRDLSGTAKITVATGQTSGKKVIEARDVDYAWQKPNGEVQRIARDFSTTVLRGDRIGIVGPNGSGKSTLLKLLLGELKPQAGEIDLGTNLEIAYFDQHRSALREDWNALDNVAGGREYIEVGGARKHALGYLQDFLFSPERARAPITRLSGGERNRLLLAKLFAQPSNLLVMDEPTNDLDVETLELLEELLAGYSGTLLLVSHDREFVDNVVTSTLVLEGNGRIGEYIGGYNDWLRQKTSSSLDRHSGESRNPAPSLSSSEKEKTLDPGFRRDDEQKAKRKLSFKDARELELLPARIERLETDIAARTQAMQTPEFFKQDAAAITAANNALAALQAELDTAYARWQELDG